MRKRQHLDVYPEATKYYRQSHEEQDGYDVPVDVGHYDRGPLTRIGHEEVVQAVSVIGSSNSLG